jgi:hypothetical protein
MLIIVKSPDNEANVPLHQDEWSGYGTLLAKLTQTTIAQGSLFWLQSSFLTK